MTTPTITLDLKKRDFLEHSKKAYKEKNLNYARQAAEAFCKIIILNEDGENADESFNKHKKIEQRINYIVNKPLIHKKVKSYLLVLQNHGNLGSHDKDNSRINENDINDGLQQLSKLIHFLYAEYFHQDIPSEIEKILTLESFDNDKKNNHQYSENKEEQNPVIENSLNDIEDSKVSIADKKSRISGSMNTIKNSTINIEGSFNNLTDSSVNINLPKHKSPKQLTATLGINTNFIGREDELKTINEKLTTSNSLLLINGIGGVGKSTIASHYLQSKQDELDYYGFFEGLDHFVTELKKPLDLKSEKTDDLFNEALWKLRELKGAKLLVIDDLKDIEEHEQTIAKILVLKEHGYQILFTSREKMDNDKVTPFYLDVLNLTDAKNLFKAIYPVPVEDESLLEAILGYLDCHTLFVELTAKTLRNKKTITLQGLKEKFDSGEFSKVSVKRRKSFGRYLSKLFVIDQLDNEEVLVLKQLAVLPSIEIPFSLLQTVFNPEDNEDFEEVLNYLSEKGWLIPSNDGYKLHQIIKEFILANNSPEFETDVFPLVENINITIKNFEKNGVIVEIMAAIVDKYLVQEHEKIIQLADRLTSVYRYFGEYNKALFFTRKILVIRKKTLGKCHRNTATSYNNLALLYEYKGDFNKALSLHKNALAIREETLGKHHRDTAHSYNNLAGLYQSQGNLRKSLLLYKKSLVITEKHLGKQHLDTATIYNNLAELYHDKGAFSEALLFYKKALVIQEKNLGEKHSTVTYSNLARLYQSQGNFTKALPMYKKTLAIQRERKGEQHPYIATLYNNLAKLHQSQGDYSQALSLFKKSLAISEKILGKQHPDTASSYNNLALFYTSQNDVNKSLPLYRKALAIREKILGKQHFATAESYNNLACFYQSQGNTDKALSLNEKALTIRKKSLGENHHDTAISYHNLATLYQSKDDIIQALPLHKKALAILEKSLGEHHPDTATPYYNLALLYKSQGNFSQALLMHEKLSVIYEKNLGEQHSDTQSSYEELIELYESQSSFSKALEIWKKVLNEPSSTTLCQKLAHAHIELKNCQRAKYYAEQVNNPPMKQLLKQIKWNIKKAKKLPPKRRGKYCKDS